MRAADQHVFFDLDGTLTDPAPGIVACYQHVIARLGLPVQSDLSLRRFIGPPLRDALAELLDSADPAGVEAAVTVYRERFGTKGLYENALYAGVSELLAELQSAGYGLWIVTSKAQVFAERIASHFGIARYFAGVYGPALSGERSDKAELIAHLLAEQRIDPACACMIGDRRHDILGAKAHGLRAIGVLWGYGSQAELVAAGADALAADVAQLGRLIERD